MASQSRDQDLGFHPQESKRTKQKQKQNKTLPPSLHHHQMMEELNLTSKKLSVFSCSTYHFIVFPSSAELCLYAYLQLGLDEV
jgi:hypothetical protein